MENNRIRYGITLSLILLLTWGLTITAAAQTAPTSPVERWGRLKVSGTQLVNQDGNPVQLQGMSLFDSTSYGDFANTASLKWLRDDWNSNVIRAAMYTEYNGQFIGTTAFNAEFKVIQAAIDAGIYVLVDWHILSDGNPLKYRVQAKDFFTQVAKKFGKYPNIIYEICNEPNGSGVTWADSVKPYAMEIIPVIRAIDPDGVILVGNPVWSSQPHLAALDPLPFTNIMYVLHYYAGTHDQGQWLSMIDQANAKGVAVFVTEWGACSAQVTPGLFYERSINWIKELDKRHVSWCNWSLGTKLESSSALKPLANFNGSWSAGELTESGLLMRALMRKDKTSIIFADSFDSGNYKAGGWVRDKVLLDKNIFRSGTTAVRFEANASLTKNLNAESSSNLSISFWYKTQDLKLPDVLNIEYALDGTTWKILTTISDAQASVNWKKAELSLNSIPLNAGKVQVRLRSSCPTDIAKFWIDDFELTATRAAIE